MYIHSDQDLEVGTFQRSGTERALVFEPDYSRRNKGGANHILASAVCWCAYEQTCVIPSHLPTQKRFCQLYLAIGHHSVPKTHGDTLLVTKDVTLKEDACPQRRNRLKPLEASGSPTLTSYKPSVPLVHSHGSSKLEGSLDIPNPVGFK